MSSSIRFSLLLLSVLSAATVAQYSYVRSFPPVGSVPAGSGDIHGIAVDPEGKVWLQPYATMLSVWHEPSGRIVDSLRPIYVFHPNGTQAPFSPITSVPYTKDSATAFAFCTGLGLGLGLDRDGHILVSSADKLIRIDHRDGRGLAYQPDIGMGRALTASAGDTLGRVFVTYVVSGTGPIHVLSIDSLSSIGMVTALNPGGSRSLAVSANGRDVYYAGYTDNQIYVYQSTVDPPGSYVLRDTIMHGIAAESFARHPRTGRIWFSSGSGQYPPNRHRTVRSSYTSHTWYEYDPEQRRLTDSIRWNQVLHPYWQRPRGIAFSPTGDTVYLAMFTAGAYPDPMVQMFVLDTIPFIEVTAPQAGVVVSGASCDTIRWNAHLVTSVDLDYSLDGGATWNAIASSISATSGRYGWTLPNVTTNVAQVRVTGAASGRTIEGRSGTFSIVESVPRIDITAPQAGVVLFSGSVDTIRWNAFRVSSVNLEYSADNGGTWHTIVSSIPALPGRYGWTIPDVTTKTACVRVSDAAPAGATEGRSGMFSIAGSNDLLYMLRRITDSSMAGLIRGLEAFGTRHSSQSNRFQVANWIRDRFVNSGVADVILDSFQLGSDWQVNVVATIPGTTDPSKEIVVGAHYDSESWDPLRAPGGDDNASGTAAVMELARALKSSGYAPNTTLRFVAFAAEERGLVGSDHFASDATAAGRRIVLMQNYDMIGHRLAYQGDRDVRVVWYAGAEAEATLDSLMKRRYTTLTPVMTTEYRSQSDSWPFFTRGIKAVFNIESDFSPAYHTPDDRSTILDFSYAAEIARSGLALLLAVDEREMTAVRGIAGIPDTLAFGPVNIGYPETLSVRIKNADGPDPLLIQSVDISLPEVTASVSTTTVPKDSTFLLTVVYAPTTVGTLATQLQILSNNDSVPVRSLFLTGTAQLPPIIAVQPDSFSVSLFSGDTTVRRLTIRNDGGSDLSVMISSQRASAVIDDPFGPMRTSGTMPPMETWSDRTLEVRSTPSSRNVLDTSLFVPIRRVWKSDEQPKILAIDVGPSENLIALDLLGLRYTKATAATIPSIRLDDFDVIYVGWAPAIYSGALQALFDRREDLLHYLAVGGGIVAFSEFATNPREWSWLPFDVRSSEWHDDALSIVTPDHPVLQGLSDGLLENWGASYHNVFTGFPPELKVLATSDWSTSPVLLAGEIEGGRVVLSGLDPAWHFTNQATAAAGLLIRNAIQWAGQGAGWLRPATRELTLGAHTAVSVDATFDAQQMKGGRYEGRLLYKSNDPEHPLEMTNVALNVTNAPGLAVDAPSIDFGDRFLGYPDTVRYRVRNLGSQDLLITSVTIQPQAYRVRPAFAGIDPGDEEIFTVVFLPDSVRTYDGSLALASNDPSSPATMIALSGRGIKPPIIAISPDPLLVYVRPGSTAAGVFSITNLGESPLRYWLTPTRAGTDISYQFDGLSSYIECPDAPSLNPQRSFTVEAWIYAFDWNGNRRILQKHREDAQYRFLSEDGQLVFHVSGLSNGYLTAPLPTTGTWHHCAGVYDDSAKSIRIYVDGALIAENTGLSGHVPTSTAPLYIGTKYPGAWEGDYFHGRIDEVRLWGTARSARQIQDFRYRSLSGSESELLAYWPFDSSDGSTVRDATSNHVHGRSSPSVQASSNTAPVAPHWFSTNIDSGQCNPQLSYDVLCRFDATSVDSGDYTTTVVISSNDPVRAHVHLTVHMIVTNSTGVDENLSVPTVTSLQQNYPNPFNPETKIEYRTKEKGWVELAVYDLLGRNVALLVDEERPAGLHTVSWDAGRLPSGVYFYTLRAGSFTQTRKMILMK